MKDDLITVTEAMGILGAWQNTIYRLLYSGRIRGEKHPVLGRWLLDRKSVEAYRDQRKAARKA